MSAGRYAHSEQLTLVDGAGRAVQYLAPRLLPRGDASGGSATRVLPGEVGRLDLVAYRTLRDAGQAWRIADANRAMDPLALCRHAGASLRVPGSAL